MQHMQPISVILVCGVSLESISWYVHCIFCRPRALARSIIKLSYKVKNSVLGSGGVRAANLCPMQSGVWPQQQQQQQFAAFQNRASERFTICTSFSCCKKCHHKLLTRYFSAKMWEICPAFLLADDKGRQKLEAWLTAVPCGSLISVWPKASTSIQPKLRRETQKNTNSWISRHSRFPFIPICSLTPKYCD